MAAGTTVLADPTPVPRYKAMPRHSVSRLPAKNITLMRGPHSRDSNRATAAIAVSANALLKRDSCITGF